MSKYEKNLLSALNNNKIIYYDQNFIDKLPNYNFLGISIKELLKNENSNEYCHACVLALSTYFKEFEIITCNLSLYEKHCKEILDSKNIYFKHSFLNIYINNKPIVIDTTFGFITNLSTYYNIFEPYNIKNITSEEINNTVLYKYIKYYQTYNIINNNIIDNYFEICKNYRNKTNPHMEDFISLYLPITTKINNWKQNKKLLYKKQ